jgi:hypothetical protein
MAVEKVREDARDQRLETRVEAFIGRVGSPWRMMSHPASPIRSRPAPHRLQKSALPATSLGRVLEATAMGINSESDTAASLQIGPTTLGMVRIYLEGDGIDLPLDFEPEEAEEIADELRAAPPPPRASLARNAERRLTGIKARTHPDTARCREWKTPRSSS